MKYLFIASGTVRSSFTHRIVALSSELAARGHEVTIIAPRADKYNEFKTEKISLIQGVRVKQPFQFASKNIIVNLLPYILAASVAVLREKADVVYIYKPTPLSVVGLLSAIVRKPVTILDMDDLGSEVMRQEGHPSYQRKLVAWCERITARRSDRIVVTSTFLYDKFRREFPKKEILIMPNGVEKSMLTGSIIFPKKLRPTLVFFGAINRKTILEPLMDALPGVIKKEPKVQALIVGSGQHLDYFKQRVIDLNIGDNVIFYGWLPLLEATKLFKAGDLGYNYMPNEVTAKAASNMKVSQYMAYGLVPLVSSIGDAPKMIEHGKAGYIAKADSVSDLRNTILQAFIDKERGDKSVEAQKIARLKFSWEVLADSFEKWLGKG